VPLGDEALVDRFQCGDSSIRVGRARERRGGDTQHLMPLARELPDVHRVRVMSGDLCQAVNRRLPHVVFLIVCELVEDRAVLQRRCRARSVHPQLPHSRSGELSERGRPARRRRARQRDQRVRGTMPRSRLARVAQIVDDPLENGDGIGGCAADRQLIEREQDDLRIAVTGRQYCGGTDGVRAAYAHRTQRLDAHHGRRIGQTLRQRLQGRAVAGGSHRQAPHLWIRIGGRSIERRLVDDARGFSGGERFERQPAHAHVARRIGRKPSIRRCHGDHRSQRPNRPLARWLLAAMQTYQRFESAGDAQPAVDRSLVRRGGHQHIVDALNLLGRRRHATEGLADRAAHARFGLDVQPCNQRPDHDVHDVDRRRGNLRACRAGERLAERVGSFGADLGKRMLQ